MIVYLLLINLLISTFILYSTGQAADELPFIYVDL
jgi:hypothetical protein